MKCISWVSCLFVISLTASNCLAKEKPYNKLKDAPKYTALIDDYCVECHNFDDWKGKLEFESLVLDFVPDDAETWEKVIRRLRGGLMPPPGEKQPSVKQSQSLVTWLENFIDHAHENQYEPIATRRLNRKEYRNAIRDLLGIQINVEELLPQDIAVDGFDNMASALSVSPAYLDQSLYAARHIATQVIGNADAPAFTTQYKVKDAGNQQHHIEGLPLGTRGGTSVQHYFPADGHYQLSIGNLARAMWVENQEFKNTLVALIDNKVFYQQDIGGGNDLHAIDTQGGSAVDAINARLKNIPFYSEAGFHTVTVTFLQRSFAESEGFLQPLQNAGQPNILRLRNFDIHGPITKEIPSISSQSRNKLFTCYPKEANQENTCAESIIQSLASKAYRGFDTKTDHQQLLQVFQQGQKSGGFENGIRRMLTALLANPKFIYHLEPKEILGVTNQNQKRLANRLALFIWGSLPDRELLDAAAKGELNQPKNLDSQLRRLLSDPKAENLVNNFAYQWLNLDGLDEIDPDPYIFAEVPSNIRSLFKTETLKFVASLFQADASIIELLQAKHTFLNETLALHYGIRNVRGSYFRRVELNDPQRWGLLGKGGVLMTSSYPNRTSPVLRGAYILEHLIGVPPTPPPPNVEALPESIIGGQHLSVRERLEVHRENPSCNGCHGVIDPLGFALENFDAVGRWREIDRFARSMIDTYGKLPSGVQLSGANDLRSALTNNSNQFVQAFTEKLMSYALSRPIEFEDMPTVRAIVKKAKQQNYSFSSIVEGIVTSPQFQAM